MNIEYFVNNWKTIDKKDISFTEKEWQEISYDEYLSEDFIEEFVNEVNWEYISRYQKLSEEFIEKYEYRVYWYWIAQNQILSEKFIYKNRDKIYYCDNIKKCLNEKYNINEYKIIFVIGTNLLIEFGFNIQKIHCSLLLVDIL